MMGVVIGSQGRDWLLLSSWADEANFGDSLSFLGGRVERQSSTSDSATRPVRYDLDTTNRLLATFVRSDGMKRPRAPAERSLGTGAVPTSLPGLLARVMEDRTGPSRQAHVGESSLRGTPLSRSEVPGEPRPHGVGT